MFSYALVAQGIEQWFPVPCVGGSNPLECIMKERMYKPMKLNLEKAKEFIIKNIRYIIVALLFIAVIIILVQCSTKDKDEKEAKDETEESVEVIPVEPEETETETDELLVNAYDNVNNLVNQYFTALQDGNVETYKQISNELTPEDEIRIVKKSEYIESYQNIVCYSKKGPVDNSYIVFAYYDIKFAGIDTLAPGLKSLYICTDESGGLYVNDAELDAEVEAYINQLAEEEDIKELIESVNNKYNEVVSADQNLRVFITNLTGILDQADQAAADQAAADQAAAEQAAANAAGQAVNETVSVTETVNVRRDASETAEKLGTAYMGETYTRTAVLDNGWSKITYNNQDAYIKSEFLTTDASQVAAGTNETVTVKETVNVRKQANENSERVGVAYMGENYTRIMKYADGWSKIDYNGTEGYVKSEYLE